MTRVSARLGSLGFIQIPRCRTYWELYCSVTSVPEMELYLWLNSVWQYVQLSPIKFDETVFEIISDLSYKIVTRHIFRYFFKMYYTEALLRIVWRRSLLCHAVKFVQIVFFNYLHMFINNILYYSQKKIFQLRFEK